MLAFLPQSLYAPAIMKALHFLSALLIAVTPAAAAETKPPAKKPTPAKKPDPKKPGAKPAPVKTDMVDEAAIALIKPYDKDGNFELDVFEFEKVQADFKVKPAGPLKQFDKGKDGALDAMMDRTVLNVKLGSAAPKKGAKPAPAPAAPPKKPEPVKQPDPPKKPA